MREKKAVSVLLICLLVFSLMGCGNKKAKNIIETNESFTEEQEAKEPDNVNKEGDAEASIELTETDFSEVFQNSNGCAIILNPRTNEAKVFNKGVALQRYSPYSTFKIIATLMGIHNGVLRDENSKMGYNKSRYSIAEWNHDLTLKDAFQYSCVWYFRKVIDAVGEIEVARELEELNYGNCDSSQWEGSNINPEHELNGFWLGSTLRISPLEQVEVLRNVFEKKACYTEDEIYDLQSIMLKDTVDNINIYGKTGTYQNKEGWYVGFVEREKQKYYFAIYLFANDDGESATGQMARMTVMNIVRKGLFSLNFR